MDQLAELGLADGVVPTGYVDDLNEHYRHATMAVSPMLQGAGVKFKTIVAMLWGLPIVATPVGAEGVDFEGGLTAITEDPEQFALAVISVLREPATHWDSAAAAQKWAMKHAGQDAFVRKVLVSHGVRPQ